MLAAIARLFVMVSKTPFNKIEFTYTSWKPLVFTRSSRKSTGFTYLELVLVMAVMATVMITAVAVYNPVEGRAKARDNKRINDAFVLERIVTEFHLDTGSYPDIPDTLRTSNTLPVGTSISLDSSAAGWINQDLRNYSTFLPLDPLNDATNHYSYIHNGTTYEINVRMERALSEMANDGGNDVNMYEIGTDLNLISP